jgi:hypothetical protein
VFTDASIGIMRGPTITSYKALFTRSDEVQAFVLGKPSTLSSITPSRF